MDIADIPFLCVFVCSQATPTHYATPSEFTEHVEETFAMKGLRMIY